LTSVAAQAVDDGFSVTRAGKYYGNRSVSQNLSTCSMDNLPFGDEEFDLIGSEGAIANTSFEEGLNDWNRFLKKDGYIPVFWAFRPGRRSPFNCFELFGRAAGVLSTVLSFAAGPQESFQLF
jgi:ubiquinone/menaquinone biosynthesis C-methylase UbiE